MTWIVLSAGFGFLVVWLASNLAGRLHQIHIRRDDLLISLRWQLIQRESLISRLLEEEFFLPQDAAKISQSVEFANQQSDTQLSEYLAAESQVSGDLREIFAHECHPQSTGTFSILQELAQCCYRIELARRFHNDAVGAAILLHKRWLVRVFRLAGNTTKPEPIDMDDTIPYELTKIVLGK
jgi:hypothetical protein